MTIGIRNIVQNNFFLPVSFLINFLLHFPYMNTPPQSVHVWRQCNTLAVARNFYKEDFNIFHTRVDNRGDTDGVTGSHFPAYEYGLASLYKLTGESNRVHRYYSMVIFYIGAIGLFYLLQTIFTNYTVATIGVFSYLFSPELFYHQINALPDILALTSSIWGFYYFIKWLKNNQDTTRLIPDPGNLLAAIIFTTLAGLTKLQYLAIGFPIAVFFFSQKRFYTNKRLILYAGIYCLISVSIPIFWYIHAARLIEQSGLRDFGIELRPETNLSKAFEILSKNITSYLPETLLNFASFVLLLAGGYFIIRQKAYNNPWFPPFLVYAVALCAYHLIELRQMEHHGYYMMPYYIVLLSLVGYGGMKLISKRRYFLIFILLVSQPVLAAIRIIPARWLNASKGVPPVLYNDESRIQIDNLIPNNTLTIVSPDNSYCIFHYFANTKGFGADKTENLFQKNVHGVPLIEEFITKGAEYIMIIKTQEERYDQLSKYTDSVITENNDILIARLKASSL